MDKTKEKLGEAKGLALNSAHRISANSLIQAYSREGAGECLQASVEKFELEAAPACKKGQ